MGGGVRGSRDAVQTGDHISELTDSSHSFSSAKQPLWCQRTTVTGACTQSVYVSVYYMSYLFIILFIFNYCQCYVILLSFGCCNTEFTTFAGQIKVLTK